MPDKDTHRFRVAVIGECLIELSGKLFGAMNQTFGGDTLNTALYLARIAGETVDVNYVTVMGTDILSDGIVQRWESEGINVAYVLRDPKRLPGLYLIQVNEQGERQFLYWRGDSAARNLVRHSGFQRIAAELASFDIVYLTGISLAILPADDRTKLIGRLKQLADAGSTIVFDSNYRPALWSNAEIARAAFSELLPAIKIVLTSFEDEQRLWGDSDPEDAFARFHAKGVKTVVLKRGADGVLCSEGTSRTRLAVAPIDPVVDTTAAGDAFNAAFIAGRLMGYVTDACCRLGSGLAGLVIQHPGAIIPKSATPQCGELLVKAGLERLPENL